MSSAMSSLRKTKKQPLTQNIVPFRNAAPTYSPNTDEQQLLEEVTSQMAAAHLKGFDSKSVVSIPQKTETGRLKAVDPKTVPSNHELMMLMTNRITSLEGRLQLQNQELADKEKKIRILEEKLRTLQKSRVNGDNVELMQLEKKSLLFQQQIYEMEAFLADYGMVWVGDRSDSQSNVYLENDETGEMNVDEGQGKKKLLSSAEVWKPATSLPSDDFNINYDQFAKNIHDLNVLAGDGIAKIEHTSDGARLKMPEPVQLTIYSNGLAMFSGPFRPFDDLLTQELVKDILDGYFPSELQGRFPEGVPFKFTDKRNVTFKDKRSELFQGEGQILGGGETDRSRLVPSSASREKLPPVKEMEAEIPGSKMTMEQFLNKIPKSVVKNGKVIDVRNSVQDTLQGTSLNGTVTVVNTPQLQQLKDRLEVNEMDRPPSGRQVTTLRIKSEFGDHTYILKMHFTDTVGDLRKYLNKERGPNASNYKIMSAFPRTVFADDSVSLFDCGLTPNATLHLSKN